MRYAIIENNIVTNIIESDGSLPGLEMVPAEDSAIGYSYADGIFTPPAPTPPVVPASVSPRQIRQALTRVGLRATVEAVIAASDQDTKDWYEFATLFERDHEKVIALAAGLGVTSSQLDDLWILADSL